MHVTLKAAIAIIETPYSEVTDNKLDIANESPVGWLIYSCTSKPDNSQLGRFRSALAHQCAPNHIPRIRFCILKKVTEFVEVN